MYKKLSSMLGVTLLGSMISFSSYAQDAGNWLAKRVADLSVEGQMREMEINGVTERSNIAVFTAEGALLYGEDIKEYSASERRDGLQFVPYKISFSTDGRKFVSVGAVAFKNIQKLKMQGDIMILDGVEGLVYEYDENLNLDGVISHKFDVVRVKLRANLNGPVVSKDKDRFLGLIGSASIGYKAQEVSFNNESLVLNRGYDLDRADMSENVTYSVGAQYKTKLNSKTKMTLTGAIDASHSKGYIYNQADSDAFIANQQDNNQAFIAAIEDYRNTVNPDISEEDFATLSGMELPSNARYSGDRANRNVVYFSPSLNLERDMGTMSLELNIKGNLPLQNNVKYRGTGEAIDLTNTNSRARVGVGIKLKF